MDKVVIDSSVAIKWFVVKPYSTEACLLLDKYQSGELLFLAPDLINTEVGNIVWKKQQFQGLASIDAQQIVDAFRLLSFPLTPTASLSVEVHQLAVNYKRTVYDAMYLALSLRQQCQFVTADEKLVNALDSRFPNVVWLANWS